MGTSIVDGPSPIAIKVAATRSSAELSRTRTSTTLRPARRFSSRGVPDATMNALLQRLVPPRKSTVADVANVIDFFLSKASDAVTAQTIYLGGV